MCFFLCLTDINFADYLKFMEYNELFARTELLIGSDAMQQIIAKKVICLELAELAVVAEAI